MVTLFWFEGQALTNTFVLKNVTLIPFKVTVCSSQKTMRTVGVVFWLSAVYCSSCSPSVISKPSVPRYLCSPVNHDHVSLVSWSNSNHFSLHAGRDHFSRHCFFRHCALWLTLPWWAPGFFPCDHANHIRLRVKTLAKKDNTNAEQI